VKALIVRLSSIGDVVHTLPALAALRTAGWDVGWMVEARAAELLAGHPLIAHAVRVERPSLFRIGAMRRMARQLREQAYDVAIDFQGLWKSALWARLSGAARVLGYAAPWRREPASAFLIDEQVDLPEDAQHVIDKNLALLRALSIDNVGSRVFPLPQSPERVARMEEQCQEMDLGTFAILNPGGGWASKLWPPDRFGALARILKERGLTPLVTWGPGEEALADRVVVASGGTARRCFPTSLLDYTELARRARVVVAADTGPLQLACAVGAPVVALFGPTEPTRNGPFGEDDIVVRRAPLCAPCHKRRCRIHADVMKAIHPDEVARAIARRLARARKERSVATG
jgi:lipopolysaccharide heptosyltransferase I